MRSPNTLALAALFALGGCGAHGLSMGDLGVTPGGTQDINYARDLIDNGLIPAATDYTTEGLFSEHSLPLQSAPCDETLCPVAATGLVDTVDGAEGRLLMQLGFATDVTLANFERPPLRLAVAIDISGSMSGDKLDTSKASLLEVVDLLGPRDEMALVTYGSKAKVVRKLTKMDANGRGKMRDEINGLKSKGSTAMEDGLIEAIEVLEKGAGKKGIEDRVFVLTDAQPNVGATGAGSFVKIVRNAANKDIGVTMWGVGLDLGAELVTEMSKVRGGNAYHFVSTKSMKKRVRDDFDFMVTPLAYDLEVDATPHADLIIDRTWGAPMDGDSVKFGASTLFLAHKDGGMGVTLTWSDGSGMADQAPSDIAELEISWLPVDGDNRKEATLEVTFEGGGAYVDDFAQADDLGVFKMAALADEILALDAGAAFCDGTLDAQTAEARILDASDRLQSRSDQLSDEGLSVESALMDKLLDNVIGGTANCNAGSTDTGL